MKIVHVYAQNLSLFTDALQDTGCVVNGSVDLEFLRKSLVNFNARDVMGLVVFKNPLTRRVLKLVKEFDELNVFKPAPIILVSDQVTDIYRAGKIKVRHSPLFLVDSFENTISDIDLRRIFTTLSCLSDEMYDLSSIEQRDGSRAIHRVAEEKEMAGTLADEVLAEYAQLGGVGKCK